MNSTVADNNVLRFAGVTPGEYTVQAAPAVADSTCESLRWLAVAEPRLKVASISEKLTVGDSWRR